MELFAFWIIIGVIVALISTSKGRSGCGWFLYGLLLWPVALVHVLLVPPRPVAVDARARAEGRVPCPYCAEMIRPEARVCPHCQRDLEQPAAHEVASVPIAESVAGAEADNYVGVRRHASGREAKNGPMLIFLGLLVAAAVAAIWWTNRSPRQPTHVIPTSTHLDRGAAPAPPKAAAAPPRNRGAVSATGIRTLQLDLAVLGYDVGPIDGVLGSRTRRALARWQSDHGRKPDGRPTRDLLDAVHADAQAHAKPAQSL